MAIWVPADLFVRNDPGNIEERPNLTIVLSPEFVNKTTPQDDRLTICIAGGGRFLSPAHQSVSSLPEIKDTR